MRFKAVTLGVVLAGTALSSAALNLGRLRGAALIGQPLEIQIPVQLDAGQTDSALCAEVDLFHGDLRQDSSRIQLVTEPTGQADTFNLRISSPQPIDEPVVTVYLRAGCGQKSARKYVMLADFPSESNSLSRTVAPSVPSVPTVVPAVTQEPAAPKPTIQTAPVTVPAVAKTAPKPLVQATPAESVKETTNEQPKTVPEAVKSNTAKAASKAEKPAKALAPQTKPSAATGKPRLRLDPVETLAERVKTLEASTTQSSAQDELARDAQRMQQLQSDLRTLLDQAVKNEASLAAMRERLEKAEAERVPVALVYGLVGLVGLCMAALAYLWTRRRPMR